VSYKYSQTDKKLKSWFENDMSSKLLRSVALGYGEIRGLKRFEIEFNYPISAIAGRNGSGKTTLLALAACAFHNDAIGFRLPSRKISYYTFSDFFIQSKDEVSPDGIYVEYGIAYDHWATTPEDTESVGVKNQGMIKLPGGKWRTYANRVNRTVIFFGIDRVVPHSEKSVSKSYRSAFKKSLANGCEEKVRAAVGKILGKTYDEFYFKSHSKYRLPFVKKDGILYSGFNMGAGENALFEIFYNLNVCPEGTLAIIDEIELGLHQEAQKRLVMELKSICLLRKIQIICTTHSPAILCEIPLSGRFYIEGHSNKTHIIPGVSGEFATGKLSGDNSCELIIYVEDVMAVSIMQAILGKTLRSRVMVLPIGSDAAIVTILAGKKKEGLSSNYLGIFDGDKRALRSKQIKLFLNRLESFTDKSAEMAWIQQRITTLPGEVWPEKWIVSKIKTSVNTALEIALGATSDEIYEAVAAAEQAEKHSEIFEFGKKIHMTKDLATQILCAHVAKTYKDEFSEIIEAIGDLLDQN
jgi:predicted ATPase